MNIYPKILLLFSLGSISLINSVNAGTVNIDFQGVPSTTASAKGALGTGAVWNDVQAVTTNNLVDDQGNPTETDVHITTYSGGFLTGIAGNDVQSDGIYSAGAGDPQTEFEIMDLRPGERYKLVIYSAYTDRIHGVIVNGSSVGGGLLTATGSSLPGTKGQDYFIATVRSDGAGVIAVRLDGIGGGMSSGCAGVQIQGRLKGEIRPWRADLMVGRTLTGHFRGNSFYRRREHARQRLSSRNSRAKAFFRVQNDGSAFDDFLVRGDAGDSEVRRSYFEMRPRSNVTARIVRGRYREELCAGESFVILASLRARRGAGGRISTHVQAHPNRSNFRRSGDLATWRLIP
jgi:hypothetical protein